MTVKGDNHHGFYDFIVASRRVSRGKRSGATSGSTSLFIFYTQKGLTLKEKTRNVSLSSYY